MIGLDPYNRPLGERLAEYDGEYLRGAMNWISVVGGHLPIKVSKSSLAGILNVGDSSFRAIELYANKGGDATIYLPLSEAEKRFGYPISQKRSVWTDAFAALGQLKSAGSPTLSLLNLVGDARCQQFDAFLSAFLSDLRSASKGADHGPS